MRLAVVVALLACATRSTADGPEQRELMIFEEPAVQAASKHLEPTRVAPSTVTVVTREEIRRQGHRTLAEVLRSVRGLYGSYDRNYDYVGVRGFLRPGDYNSRILILVNGHTYNDDIYQTALLGTEFGIDLEAVERVEVVRGPGSSLYGGNALFAVVNVVTREPTGDRVEGRVETGSFGRKRGHVLATQQVGDLRVFASGSIFDVDGAQDLRYPRGVAPHGDGARAYNAFVLARWGGWTLQGGANRREKQLPTGAYGTTLRDPRNETTDARRFAELAYTAAPRPDVTVTARGFYDSYGYHGTYVYGAVKNEDYAQSHWFGAEVRTRWQLVPTNALTVGAEYTHHPGARQRNFNLPSGIGVLDDRQSYSVFGLYAQDEWTIVENLRLVGGLRFDRYYDRLSEVSPRAAVVWQPLARTTVKLLAGRAFRPPNLFEQYYSFDASDDRQLANPDLEPERITTYEASVEQGLWHGAVGEVTLYQNDIEDLIEPVTLRPVGGVPRTQYRNLRSVDAHGAEVELRVPLPRRAQLRAHYAIQEAVSEGRILSNSPRHLGGISLLFPLPLGLLGGSELLVVGPRRTRSGARLEAAPILNVTVLAPLPIKGLELDASIYNLLDRTYPDPVGSEIDGDRIAQDGLTFRLGLSYAF